MSSRTDGPAGPIADAPHRATPAHTPGPWVAHYGWESEHLMAPDPNNPRWCEVTGGSFKDGTYLSIPALMGIANARLIAAAPDLLNALIGAVAAIEEVMEPITSNGMHAEWDEVMAKQVPVWRALIAKATGAA